MHLILLLVLSVLVVRQRRKHQVVLGDADIPELAQAVRAFGNATEYVPGGLIAIAVLAMAGAPPMVVHAIGLTLSSAGWRMPSACRAAADRRCCARPG